MSESRFMNAGWLAFWCVPLSHRAVAKSIDAVLSEAIGYNLQGCMGKTVKLTEFAKNNISAFGDLRFNYLAHRANAVIMELVDGRGVAVSNGLQEGGAVDDREVSPCVRRPF